jgi:hypothetical protein
MPCSACRVVDACCVLGCPCCPCHSFQCTTMPRATTYIAQMRGLFEVPQALHTLPGIAVGRTRACLVGCHDTTCTCLLDCCVWAGCLAPTSAAMYAAVSATAFCGACRCCIMMLIICSIHPLAWLRPPACVGAHSQSGTTFVQ